EPCEPCATCERDELADAVDEPRLELDYALDEDRRDALDEDLEVLLRQDCFLETCAGRCSAAVARADEVDQLTLRILPTSRSCALFRDAGCKLAYAVVGTPGLAGATGRSYLARYGSICENVCGAVVGPGRGPMGGREAGRGADDVLE
ncbi:hypothetical protein THAOC_37231, partial [Thalassiosira oceanica]